FSCDSGCACPPVYDSSYMSPSSLDSVVGDVSNPFLPMQMKRDCMGQLFGPYDMSGSTTSWNSADTSVATVNSVGTVECVGVGSTNIVAYFTAVVAYGAPGVPCEPHTANIGAPGNLNVLGRCQNRPLCTGCQPGGFVCDGNGSCIRGLEVLPLICNQLRLTYANQQNPSCDGGTCGAVIQYD